MDMIERWLIDNDSVPKYFKDFFCVRKTPYNLRGTSVNLCLSNWNFKFRWKTRLRTFVRGSENRLPPIIVKLASNAAYFSSKLKTVDLCIFPGLSLFYLDFYCVHGWIFCVNSIFYTLDTLLYSVCNNAIYFILYCCSIGVLGFLSFYRRNVYEFSVDWFIDWIGQ